jgi:hypothetical protein
MGQIAVAGSVVVVLVLLALALLPEAKEIKRPYWWEIIRPKCRVLILWEAS